MPDLDTKFSVFDDKSPENFAGKYLGNLDDINTFVKENEVDEIYYTLSGENEKACALR